MCFGAEMLIDMVHLSTHYMFWLRNSKLILITHSSLEAW